MTRPMAIREIRLTRIARALETRTSWATTPPTGITLAARPARLEAMKESDRLAELRAEALHHRQRRDLYVAKTYGLKLTSAARLRELTKASELAEARLRHALTEADSV